VSAVQTIVGADGVFTVWLRRRGLSALGLLLLLFATRATTERIMWVHMVIQIPALVSIGVWCAGQSPGWSVRRWNVAGAPGLLLASSIVACWMVPRLLDAAVERTAVDALKFGSLVLAGAIGYWSWRIAPTLVRVFAAGNAAWMMATVGLLLLDAPVRLCVRYGSTDQQHTGYALIGITAVVIVSALLRAGLPLQSVPVDSEAAGRSQRRRA